MGLGATGLVLNQRLRPGTDVWLMDDQDMAEIAGPAGRIIARHAPVDPGQASDFTDAAAIAVGVAGYSLKNIAKVRAAQGVQTVQQPPPQGPSSAPSAPATATPFIVDDGPVAPTEAFHEQAFHDHFPPPA